MRFDEQFIRTVVPDAIFLATMFPEDIRCSIDTRTLVPGEVFIALKGERVDGHAYIEQALEKGAAGVIAEKTYWHTLDKKIQKTIEQRCVQEQRCLLLVFDTRQALYALARAWRNQFTYPVVAITGSVGKTSTKHMLASILQRQGSAMCVSHGNQNPELGIALNMLRMRSDHKAAIFEVGINKKGEMRRLARLLKPTTALITAIGHAHMEGLGTLHDIALEKRALFSCFSETNIGVIHGDQPLLSHVAYSHPVVKFGTKMTNQIQARKVRVHDQHVSFVLKIYTKKYVVHLPRPHEGAVFNALAAAALAHLLGVDDETIVQSVQQPVSLEGRFEIRSLCSARGILINDCYNANPESMKAALLAFQALRTPAKKVAVLGDMLELGSNSPFWHRQLGRFLRKVTSLDHLILVGDQVAWIKKTAPVGLSIDHVAHWHEAVEKLRSHVDQEAAILVKGSRGMQLHELVRTYTSASSTTNL